MGQNDAPEQKQKAKVVNILDFRAESLPKASPAAAADFNDLMEKNRKNQERLKSERNKANLSVIRGQQLKK